MLCVGGDFDPDEARRLVHAALRRRARRAGAAARPAFGEPDLDAERRKSTRTRSRRCPPSRPAGGCPTRSASFADYLPYVVLAEVLTDGDASRLEQRLVQKDRTVTQIAAYLGLIGDPFDVRDPTALILQAHHTADVAADEVLDAATEEFDRLATTGWCRGELDRVRARILAQLFRRGRPGARPDAGARRRSS